MQLDSAQNVEWLGRALCPCNVRTNAQRIRTQIPRLLRLLPVPIHNDGQTLLVLQDTHECHNLTIMPRTISIYLCILLGDVNKSSITTVTIPTHKTSIYCFLDLFRKRSRQQGQRASLCTPKVMSMIRYVLHHDAELTYAFTCYTNRCYGAMPRCSAGDEYSIVICTLAVIYNGQNLPTYQNPERSSSRAYKVWVSPFLACMT
jgi:hypothetical protein